MSDLPLDPTIERLSDLAATLTMLGFSVDFQEDDWMEPETGAMVDFTFLKVSRPGEELLCGIQDDGIFWGYPTLSISDDLMIVLNAIKSWQSRDEGAKS